MFISDNKSSSLSSLLSSSLFDSLICFIFLAAARRRAVKDKKCMKYKTSKNISS